MSSKNIFTIIVSGLVIIGLGFGIFWFAQSRNNSSSANQIDFVEGYSEHNSSKLSQNKANVIFFHASWCPTCQASEKDILENKNSIPSNLQILKADYDKETDLKKKYGVTTQHTFVLVDQNGQEIKKATGLNKLSQIVTFANVANVSESMKDSSITSVQTNSATSKDTSMVSSQASKGEYTSYNSNLLSRADDGKVIIFFNASWCPSCQATVKNINSNLDNIPSKLTILSADYDKETDLKKKYGVTYQHTFVLVDSKGNQIKKASGLNTLNDIANFSN